MCNATSGIADGEVKIQIFTSPIVGTKHFFFPGSSWGEVFSLVVLNRRTLKRSSNADRDFSVVL